MKPNENMTWDEFKNWLYKTFDNGRKPGQIGTGGSSDFQLYHETDYRTDEPNGKYGIMIQNAVMFFEDGRVKVGGKMYFNRSVAQMYCIIKNLTEPKD